MEYQVLSNQVLLENTALYDLKISAPDMAKKALPGQIAHLYCGKGTTLRRPLSICESDPESGIVRFCYEVRGEGTQLLSQLTPDSSVDVIGPYGHPFTVLLNAKKVLLVGGGIGIYPLLSLAHQYCEKATALLGFRTVSIINMIEDFEATGASCRVITDDGSNGKKGFVSLLVEEELAQKDVDLVCVCGPKPMMKAVALACQKANIPCQVSMEEHMACGVGACLGCICKTMFYENNEQKETYKRVCVDGPVFDAKEIIW